MQNKIFVGSISFKTTNDGLRDHFAQVGTVTSATVHMDKMTGRSSGFGFVEFSSEEEAKAAVEKLNGVELDGRPLFVDIARPKAEGFKRN
ncbi:RNA-binding protein [Candidatus Nomurabacteria bacterium]|nr:RNA-binding protein [Candidatus Nomurabacteria bacterium]